LDEDAGLLQLMNIENMGKGEEMED